MRVLFCYVFYYCVCVSFKSRSCYYLSVVLRWDWWSMVYGCLGVGGYLLVLCLC